MWRQNGSGCGHSARAPTGSPPRLPGSSAGAGASRAAVAAATGVLAAASAEAAPPLSQARTASALGAANRRVRLRSDGSSPKGIEWQLTSSSTLRRFQPGPFRRGATCGPSTGSVYGRVRWVSPVNATPTASGSASFNHSFNHCFEEFSPRLSAASPAGPALHSPMPGCGGCP